MLNDDGHAKLSHPLLDTFSHIEASQPSLSSCLDALGLYHPTQYVLRLSYSVHKLVDSATKKKNGDITWEEFQAFSTYLHETVHWWQFIGSTTGFMLSMGYPAQTHNNMEALQHLAKSKKAKKPLMAWAEAEMRRGKDHTDPDIAYANTVTNNTLDIAFYRSLIINASDIKQIATLNYFESKAHAFNVAYVATLNILKSMFDPESEFLPNADDWHDDFESNKAAKLSGFFYGSPLKLYPIRGFDIIEGQARFIQLQFLSAVSENKITFEQIEKEGYLQGVYGEAFKLFLQLTNSEAPKLIDSPLVALYLLVCDISLNPSEGFPKTVSNMKDFINVVDCNYRFLTLCKAVKENSHLKFHIKDCSKKEYLEVAQILTQSSGLEHPYEIPTLISKWKKDRSSIQELLRQQDTFDYDPESIAIRVLFSHFITFNLDKLEAPEFFCWAGKHFMFGQEFRKYQDIWLRNLSLYSDHSEEQTILPRMIPGKPEYNIKKTFNAFYAANLVYNLSSQWVTAQGAFKYEFSWLTEREDSGVIKDRTSRLFENIFKVHPDNISY
ncbi:hypothetical protein [Pseudomonas sp. R3-52-08]|uniref:hypothetical protein n=1 Tax=Pseudomonas sp. R3-52-08 TaxID=1173284 RepID=UPI000F57CF4A|nr:hypothetical protein [Pseudomonas sp. R3-52-08]AZF21772.1 hypothetical protein C4J91_3024 [Pseudomonas sp. R3-52-08]